MDTTEGYEGRDLVGKERTVAQQYSAQRRYRLYLVGFASSSLNLSDGRLTGTECTAPLKTGDPSER